MARYRRRDAVEHRLADELEVDGRRYTVDLVAKRATGVEGYRTTVSFASLEGGESLFAELDPTDSREEATRIAEELRADPERLRALARAERG